MSLPPKPPASAWRWSRILLICLIVLGLFLTIFFGVRAARSYLRIWQTSLQPGVTDVEAIRGWMTVPYVARAYGVPEEIIFERLDIPPEDNRSRSLAQLNRLYAPGERGLILNMVKQAVKTYLDEHSSPGNSP
jgi:hypothetical protein